jgi:lipid-A-disaccharide synthase
MDANHAHSPPAPRLRVVADASTPLPTVLFTAFEPSGDDHACAVIAELRRRYPALPIDAWGGPKMKLAGATLLESTCDDAVMGLPGLRKVAQHLGIRRRVKRYLQQRREEGRPVKLHVPVDSPAANTPLCKVTKAQGCTIVHLVAPQIWAWGRWRIHTLRELTSQVLCLLPFEQEFFRKRNVPAQFIGHFLFDVPVPTQELDLRSSVFGEGSPRIAMMPGSRPDELKRHLPMLLDVYAAIKDQFPQASGVIAATSDRVASLLRSEELLDGRRWPESVRIVTQDTDAVVRWCDFALVKSGTVTLQVTRQHKPMVIFYVKSNPVGYVIAKAVLSTKHFALPNLLAGTRIVPEFIPHYGGPAPIAAAAISLLRDQAELSRQVGALRDVTAKFTGHNATHAAADAIEVALGLRPHA